MAFNELAVGNKVSRKLQKDYDDDESYHPAFNQPFTGFPKDVGLNNGLSPPQPDFIEGLGIVEFQPFPIQYVSGAVLYKDNLFSTVLPHIAGEYKGLTGCMANARLQCSYDGAALVYARNKALALVGKPDPLGHAKITTFATNGEIIEFFAHYAAQGDDGKLKYQLARKKYCLFWSLCIYWSYSSLVECVVWELVGFADRAVSQAPENPNQELPYAISSPSKQQKHAVIPYLLVTQVSNSTSSLYYTKSCCSSLALYGIFWAWQMWSVWSHVHSFSMPRPLF